MKQYLNLLQHVLDNGVDSNDRTGTGTLSDFMCTMKYDLSKGFPLVTTKKVFWKGVVHELLWMISGSTNIKYLQDNGVHIWDEWADENGDLGPVYGKQWREWENIELREPWGGTVASRPEIYHRKIDQIREVIEQIKTNPNSRRHIVTAWNPVDIKYMALPPCHYTFQFYVRNGKISCHLTQRSGDLFLGIPFNIASYSLLTHMVAKVTKLDVGYFGHTIIDCHIYKNHIEQVKEQLSREPRELPKIDLNDHTDIDDFKYEDIILDGYNPHPTIKAKVSV